jgi:hypothetical protein
MELSETACVVPLIVRRVIMKGSTAGFAERLFGSQNQIAIMDHLAEWTRLHLDARFASAQLYDHKRKRLRVVAQREFAPGLQFGEIPITSGTVCARAARLQMPILIPDVTRDEDWIPFLSFSESAGFGGVLSISVAVESRQPDRCHVLSFFRPREADKNRNEFRQGKLRIRQRCDH